MFSIIKAAPHSVCQEVSRSFARRPASRFCPGLSVSGHLESSSPKAEANPGEAAWAPAGRERTCKDSASDLRQTALPRVSISPSLNVGTVPSGTSEDGACMHHVAQASMP